MILTSIRHARAEDSSPRGDDASRALTEDGIARLAKSRAGLLLLGFAPERILHSPLLRAVQTAERLAEVLVPTEVHPGLACAPDQAFIEDLAGRTNRELCCVGHEPWLTELASLLCAGDRGAADFELKKAGAIVLDGEPRAGGMRMTALLTPRALRLLR